MKLTFSTYEHYKDSGIQWLGEIPGHWEVRSLKWSSIILNGYSPEHCSPNVNRKLGVPYLKVENIDRDSFQVKNDYEFVDFKFSVVKEGDILFPKRGAAIFLNKISISDFESAIDTNLMGLRITEGVTKFVFYVLKSVSLVEIADTSTIPQINKKHIDQIKFSYPPLPEQQRIADFLEKKTGQIEAAIGRKERQIALLKEHKQILIHQAVTLGLNPDAPMKDSGVDWIGHIPSHWEVKKLKWLLAEINERSLDGQEDLLSVSQYTGVTLKRDNMEIGELISTAESLEGYKKVAKGDLVSNIMLAWNGSLGFSPYSGITSPAYSVYRLIQGHSKEYFHYLLRTDLFKAEYKRNSTGVIESRLRLYTDDFFKVFGIIPPFSEQASIAEFLDKKTSEIEAAILLKTKEIQSLKELKTTLINAAVTGKIKV